MTNQATQPSAEKAPVQPMGIVEDAIDVLRAVARHFKDTDAPLGNAARDVVRRFDALSSGEKA